MEVTTAFNSQEERLAFAKFRRFYHELAEEIRQKKKAAGVVGSEVRTAAAETTESESERAGGDSTPLAGQNQHEEQEHGPGK